MRFVRTVIWTELAIFTNCLPWVRQNFQQSQLICCSKNSITSQNKWHEAHDFSYSFSICVLNEACDSHIHLISVYWMKHVTFQLPECSSLHSFILFFLSYPNFISLQSYCSFILFFHALAAFYCHQEWQHFSKKRGICYRYSTATASS